MYQKWLDLPLVLILQKNIIKGITAGAVKG